MPISALLHVAAGTGYSRGQRECTRRLRKPRVRCMEKFLEEVACRCGGESGRLFDVSSSGVRGRIMSLAVSFGLMFLVNPGRHVHCA
jgi:hypothetical protein